MLPTLLELGPIKINSYGLMLAIGFILGVTLVRRECKRLGINPDIIADGAFWTLLVGLFGSRLAHILLYPSSYSWRDPLGWVAFWRGGLVFQGALLAIPFVYWYVRRKKIDFWPFADIAASYIPLGHAFGRLGCFLNGCCYGKRSDVFWAIPFRRVPFDLSKEPTGSPAYLDHCARFGLSYWEDKWSFPVHPTQLYSAVGLLLIFALLMVLRKKHPPFCGFVLPMYLTLYGLGRFVLEFFRGDHNPSHFGGHLSDQQVFSLLLAVVGTVLFFYLRRKAYHSRDNNCDKA
ncbi:MAG TPA: prolipoprotein diacylglyceryl transferase [Candidatus Hydrogenedentes bacterium]|nr:prolipoprotein diacylglyceryl transferase [Candidatus Hydrogenedentota bacterium]HQH50981.1 prolipoprotein diacylglyceryl transferase [Candidatus Hydrogenedentota bacterium]